MFDEREVIPRILRGDLKAFDLLVKQYEKLVFHIIYKLLSDETDAEDVSQEVFIKVYRNLKSFAFQSKLSTWIARIAYTSTINHLRKHKKDSTTSYPDDIEQYHFTNQHPENVLMKKDTAAYINYLVEQMPHHYKTVITLYHLSEFSYLEIEEITGIPEGTIKSYLFRGRKLLKEKLADYLKNETI